jgi:Tfp pilus assembly pilus retraction ATPase PilT
LSDIKKLINTLLEYATEQGADLHICPKSAPFVRLGGIGELKPIPDYINSPLDIATVKALINELLTPEQRGELLKHKYADFSYTHSELGRFRLNVYTQRGTHAITIHTLPFDVPNFYKLELPNEAIWVIEHAVTESAGLFIVAGDYFSGKSATLASLVDLINDKRNCHISTIESPIEYLHRHKKAMVIQKEIGADVADFQTALEQIRQENPDVVVLSDLRNEDLLSVMELAEERLVLASLKVNHLQGQQKDAAFGVLHYINRIARNETERNNLLVQFIPNPNISVIFQYSAKPHISGELITWDMRMQAKGNKETSVIPITFGRSADDGAGDGRADTGSA